MRGMPDSTHAMIGCAIPPLRHARSRRRRSPASPPPRAFARTSSRGIIRPSLLEAEPDRSRRGVRPISRRKWTDLDAEYDRSRAGI